MPHCGIPWELLSLVEEFYLSNQIRVSGKRDYFLKLKSSDYNTGMPPHGWRREGDGRTKIKGTGRDGA